MLAKISAFARPSMRNRTQIDRASALKEIFGTKHAYENPRGEF
jgi:hypothetical protein